MEVNELRLGNFIECFGIRQVCSIKHNKIKVQSKTEKGNYILEWSPIDSLELKPIPITKDWLLKFGFEETEFVFRIEKFFLQKSVDRKSFLYQAHQNRFSIKHVHQLQNLYFALIGEELKYNTD